MHQAVGTVISDLKSRFQQALVTICAVTTCSIEFVPSLIQLTFYILHHGQHLGCKKDWKWEETYPCKKFLYLYLVQNLFLVSVGFSGPCKWSVLVPIGASFLVQKAEGGCQLDAHHHGVHQKCLKWKYPLHSWKLLLHMPSHHCDTPQKKKKKADTSSNQITTISVF